MIDNTPQPDATKRHGFKLKPGERIYELDVAKKEFEEVKGVFNQYSHKHMVTLRDGCWYCVAKTPDYANKKFNEMAIETLKKK